MREAGHHLTAALAPVPGDARPRQNGTLCARAGEHLQPTARRELWSKGVRRNPGARADGGPGAARSARRSRFDDSVACHAIPGELEIEAGERCEHPSNEPSAIYLLAVTE